MNDVSPSARHSLEANLANARQIVELLLTQMRADIHDSEYTEARLNDLSNLLTQVAKQHQSDDRERRLAALYEVCRTIGNSLDQNEVITEVMDSIIHLAGAERGFLLMFDETGTLEVRAARNVERDILGEEEFAISRTVIENVSKNGEPVLTTNASVDPRFSGRSSVVTHQLRSIQCVPLKARGEVMGVLYVDNRIRSGVFNDEDLDMLEAFAIQAAMAIENARLFMETDHALSQRALELAQLNEIDKQLNETLDFTSVMNTTLEWAAKVTGADNGAIALIDLTEGQTRILAEVGQAPASVTAMLESKSLYAPGEEDSIAVPIQREGRVIGVIGLERNDGRDFAPEAFEFVMRLADHAATSIQNARLYDAVKRANEAKSEFVSVMTHELRIPMTAIKGYAEMLAMVGDVNEQQAKFVEIIRGNVERMTQLVNDLSDLSKIEAGILPMDIEYGVSLHSIMDEVMPSLDALIEELRHTFTTDLPADLPELTADPKRVVQILTNLISNAAKYTPEGGMITVRARETGNMILCEVSDTGIGMSDEELEHLYRSFWRGEDPFVREQPGSGLGLTIARNLVELQGGEIDITSRKDEGTTVSFTLPVMQVPPQATS